MELIEFVIIAAIIVAMIIVRLAVKWFELVYVVPDDLFKGLDEDDLRQLDAHERPEHARSVVLRRKMIASLASGAITFVLLTATYISEVFGAYAEVSTFLKALMIVFLVLTLVFLIVGCLRALREHAVKHPYS